MSDGTETLDDRCITSRLLDPKPGEWALMGPAHAISGSAAAVLAIGLLMFFQNSLMESLFHSSVVFVLFFVVVATGGALSNDLDNSRSTVNSSLGFVGAILSSLFRASSLLIQSVIRTSKDDSTPDPHRGFWHTVVGAITLGAIAYGLSSIPLEAFMFNGESVTFGAIFFFIFSVVMIHLFFAGIAKSRIKKIKDIPIVGELLVFVLSISTALVFILLLPEDAALCLGVAIAFGATMHILGDALTVSGVPIFFPLPVINRKKFWWKTRFAKFQANDDALNANVRRISIAAIVAGISLAAISFILR